MREEEKVVEEEQGGAEKETVTEDLKVQAQDLFKTINDLIREGSVRSVKIIHKERTLVDIPLVAGMASSVLLAVYMPHISAIAAVVALLGGCTVRIEREESQDEG
jgi:hypothetical protein